MGSRILTARRLLAMALLVGALATACGGDDEGSGGGELSGEVSFLVFGEP
jgi:hypothetical protein